MSIEHWIWLSELDTDRKTKFWLAETFGDAERVYSATQSELEAAGVSASFSSFLSGSRTLERAAKITTYCRRHNIGIINLNDDSYPERLRNIPVPPTVLYTLGQMPDFDRLPAISVVGSRNVDTTERNLSRSFAAGLAHAGMLVVSGMALGIDGMANMGAMDAGMNTIAVFGSGVDVCYPVQNRPIYERILSSGGCIISEYPPGSRPSADHFPERNRIISGLSLGTVVIAAPYKSGALITANCALEQGRDIFVVPGGIDNPRFAGSNRLIKDGAIPVTEPADVVNEYKRRYPEMFDKEPAEEPVQPAVQIHEVYKNEAPARAEKAIAKEIRYNEPQEPEAPAPEEYDLSRLKKHDPIRHFGKIENLFKTKSSRKSDKPEPAVKEKPVIENKKPEPELTEKESRVYEAIKAGKTLTDEIIDHTGIPTGELVVTLTMLTMKGVIEELPGRRFRIKS